MNTWKQLTELKEHTDIVRRIQYSKDGKLLASCSSDKSIIIWDTETYKSILKLIDSDQVFSICFTPNCEILYSGGYFFIKFFI